LKRFATNTALLPPDVKELDITASSLLPAAGVGRTTLQSMQQQCGVIGVMDQ